MPTTTYPALAIMCGLPRSGKTTIAKKLEDHSFAYRWIRVSPDEIRLALHGEKYLQRAEPFIWATAEVMARALLMGDKRVLIDATNVTKQVRAMWVKLAKEYNVPLEIYLVETPAATCIERAQASGFDPVIIERMAGQYERPTHDEGTLLRYVAHNGIYYERCACEECQEGMNPYLLNRDTGTDW